MILQIETATTVCSVAIASEGKTLTCIEVEQRNVHAEKITLFIDETLRKAGKTYADIDAVAVSSGPGSYTGLRIGVSAAKGLCFALDKPLIAVETLAAMADGFRQLYSPAGDSLLCPMIDARRMEVFTAIFDSNGNKIKSTSAEIIDENSFADLLSHHQIIFFGDGAEKCREVLGLHRNAHIVPDFTNSASHLSQRAFQKFLKQDFEDVAYFEPYYLKDFIAGKKAQ
ncbi:MAG TPA: tRNA (adenosine(37)-N6)-threonylcarbamoyltransferase complex dimerization subunit type 1 TsaB [Mucilaginibacter sp.]|jgi:tRNA threonylcarbamoyladenosine biosynthesis protein TsaB|nr:tRNA (adenosine(37)-N6)-threonylcarbamoyltransferase complex dimerization subunit type 1 TsaB [Mucilaginibacter sp.]